MKARTSLSLCALAVLALVAVQPAPCLAGFIGDTDGNTVTATAEYSTSYCPPISMVNGSAMSDSPVVKTSTSTATWWIGSWLTHQVDSPDPHPSTGWVLFNFAKNTSLKEIVIWNLLSEETNAAYGRGMKAVTITYSTDSDTTGLGGGTIFSGDLKQATWTGDKTQHTIANGWGYTDDFTFPEVQNVKAVKITFTSNYGGDGTGLSEVRFAPEPATLALLGLGGLSVLLRRKSR
jgi:hypothetical protein